MITLIPTRLHWVKDDDADDPCDLCAHSPVRFEVNGETLVGPEDGGFTASATAIYLLRTLEQDHTQETPVGEHLFPCCGHVMLDTGGDDVLICGCPNGTNFDVVHHNDTVCITSTDGRSHSVAREEWRHATNAFTDLVRKFYDNSLPKTPPDDEEATGFARMMTEWKRRRTQE
ncbi:MAG: hypothetical protein HQ518_21840 [Rhodopirellula sp.]|nr:hypothetical protein [Rhodopirellula sp.]